MFAIDAPGTLVSISGEDASFGSWQHRAFRPSPLTNDMPPLQAQTFVTVAEARASLAALDNTARQLPNPTLLRLPTLRREAQSTSALEGTYAPLAEVLIADDEDPGTADLIEILNFVHAANHGYAWIGDGRPITASFLEDVQGLLMNGTPLEEVSGRLRDVQVVIGRRDDADPRSHPVYNARFVPSPPGKDLEHALQILTDWIRTDHRGTIDPVVAAAMSHYQFETLHPFHDGNGRVGRLLIVLHLQVTGVLSEPTLSVSPWFEARRSQYYDALFGVSTQNDWDSFVRFFAEGLRQSADTTKTEMVALARVQEEMKAVVRASPLRADSAHALVDLAVANPSFTVRKVESDLDVSYGRANKLVGQLVELGLLAVVDPAAYKRRFYAPQALDVLTKRTRH